MFTKKIIQIKSFYPIGRNIYKNAVFFLFLIILLTSSTLYSQVNKEKKTLIDVLTILEEKHNYQFTYADDILKDILIESPPDSLQFKEIINYLSRKTHLTFQFLNNNFIAINSSHTDTSFFICGYILDTETNTPLEAVTIVSENNHITTNSLGYFKLEVTSKKENISIRYLGYKSISQLAYLFDQDKCSDLYLIPEVEILSEIILSNYLAKGINKAINGTYDINFSSFGILPGLIETDVLQTIQALPGIQSVNETISNINVRGGSHDQNLITWDGIKMYQSGHFFGLISIFNPLITKDVSVIKNGTDVDYTDGISSTIVMKTNTKVNATLTGSIGSNFINSDGFVDVPLGEKSSFQLSARKAISEFVETPTYNNYFDRIEQDTEVENINNSNANFDFYDTSFRWLYDVTDKDKIRVNFLNINNKLIFKENEMINQIKESKESGIMQRSIAGSLFYKRNWSNAFSTTLQVTETRYELEAINADILKQKRLKQVNKIEETSIKLSTYYKPNKQLSLLSGYQFTETAINNLTDIDDPRFIRLVREVIREHGLYSQINYATKSNKTHIKVGARYNYIEKFKKHIIEPRLSINHKLSSHFNLELLGEFKHQNTSQIINFQNDFLGVEKRRWFLSDNNDIPVVISKQASLGIDYNNKGWLISIESYFKNVDGITSQSQGFINQYLYEKSIGSYNVYGIDFLLNKRIKKISTWLSYSFTNNEYTFNNFEEINFSNNLEIKHSITFGTSFSTGNFKASAGVNWHTGIPITIPVLGNEIINYEIANSSNLKDFLRVDASVTYKLKLTNKLKATMGVSIWNALNHQNIINRHYIINENDQIEEVTKKALGLTPNLSLKVSF